MPDREVNAARSRRIQAAFERGDSFRAIASAEGVSVPTVRAHLGHDRPRGERLPLLERLVVEAYLNYEIVTGSAPNSSLWRPDRAWERGGRAIWAFELGWVSVSDNVHRHWPLSSIDVSALGGWDRLRELAAVERERRLEDHDPLIPPPVPVDTQQMAWSSQYVRSGLERGAPRVPPEMLIDPDSPARGVLQTVHGPVAKPVPELRHVAVVGSHAASRAAHLARQASYEQDNATSTVWWVLGGALDWLREEDLALLVFSARQRPEETISLFVDAAESLVPAIVQHLADCPPNLHFVAAWDPVDEEHHHALFALLPSRHIYACRDEVTVAAFLGLLELTSPLEREGV